MEKIWAITSQNHTKIHRLTFSQSLAQHIVDTYPQYQMKRMTYKIGKELNPGERSTSGLYALMSRKSNVALRISLIQGISEIHLDESSRYLAEAWLE